MSYLAGQVFQLGGQFNRQFATAHQDLFLELGNDLFLLGQVLFQGRYGRSQALFLDRHFLFQSSQAAFQGSLFQGLFLEVRSRAC